MTSPTRKFFDIAKIQENYRRVQEDFNRINGTVDWPRDTIFDEGISTNLLTAYDYLNRRILESSQKQTKNFAPCDPSAFLEINTLVHLGTDMAARQQYQGFLETTQKKFFRHFSKLQKWCKRHEDDHDDPYRIAAGLYVRILGQPQLFFDGNHRSGALIANDYLMSRGENPFVLTPENAVAFLNLASDVKFKKRDIKSRFKRAVGWKDEVSRMRDFLKDNAAPFVTDAYPAWQPPPPAPSKRTVTASVTNLSRNS